VPDGLAGPQGGTPEVTLASGTAWADGKPVSFLDFGKATFTWNENAVIDEVPIYVLQWRTAEGGLLAPDIRTVAGTGPPGSGGPRAPVIGGQARYVAYWRIYTVTVPPTARAFLPLSPDVLTTMRDKGIPVVDQYTDDALLYADALSGWVAVNGAAGCFATAAQLEPDPTNSTAGKCVWLDSQAAIEKYIDPSAIKRTDVTVTCPFVTFNSMAVSPIK
jgi:hypothetical protein